MNSKMEESKTIEAKAEFIITISWPNENSDDVDTYVEDPLGNLVFFRSREKGLMHLDRDDLGSKNDTIQDAVGNTISFPENREIVTIRGIIPGEYVINAHMYRKSKSKNEPTAITAKLEKINPYGLGAIKEKQLIESGDEATFFRFRVDEQGNITDINDIEKPLAQQESQNYGNVSTPFLGQ